jgi:phosphoribosyl-ATP pyrophosphohydrolase/phosphoribosyl-AMP cyclohydrolase
MIDPDSLDWAKMDELLPAIVQDEAGRVRMLGYVNRAALVATVESGWVTFFSRSKGRLWTKGETSGNRLRLLTIAADCDGDSLLLTVAPEGPTCHLGTTSCFGATAPHFFPEGLEEVVRSRTEARAERSYTARLLAEGIARVAQKVGEEGVEVALAAVSGDQGKLVSEAADLAFHLTLLLKAGGLSWADVAHELESRHAARQSTASS